MLEDLMTNRRRFVVTILASLLGVMVLLWFVRGPGLDRAAVMLFAVSTLLVPFAAFAVYGIVYFNVRVNHISARAVRVACGAFLFFGAAYLGGSTLFAIYQVATHRLMPPPNLLAFGLALGAMKAWHLQPRTTALK